MNYQEFAEQVKNALPEKLSGNMENATVDTVAVDKLQGESYSGIVVRPEDSSVGITINLDRHYEQFTAGVPFEQIMENIAEQVNQGQMQMPDFALEQLTNYDEMKQYLTVQLVGKADNAEMLSNIPSQQVEDMAMVYRFLIDKNEGMRSSLLMTNNMMQMYGITQEQLHQDALAASAMNAPAFLKNMNEIMYEMSGGLIGGPDMPEAPMYVASNDDKTLGASVMFYPDFMDQAAEKLGGNFYVLPSSIHEVILVPDSFGARAEELKAMVMEVNGSEVSAEDKLTDNVYHYDSEARVFEQAEKFEKRMEKTNERKSVLDELGSKKQECAAKVPKAPTAPKKDDMSL